MSPSLRGDAAELVLHLTLCDQGPQVPFLSLGSPSSILCVHFSSHNHFEIDYKIFHLVAARLDAFVCKSYSTLFFEGTKPSILFLFS